MPHYKKIVGEKCYLSPCSPEDAEQWALWDNDLEVTVPLGDEAYVPTALARSQEQVNHAIQDQEHVFSIVDLATDAVIGRCMLFGVNHVDRNAMLGIVIGDKSYWGKGYGQEATALLADYGFNLLNLNNIMLGVFEFNTRAIHCYQQVGFKEIGRRRQARIIGGRKFDVILMDILAGELRSKTMNRLLLP